MIHAHGSVEGARIVRWAQRKRNRFDIRECAIQDRMNLICCHSHLSCEFHYFRNVSLSHISLIIKIIDANSPIMRAWIEGRT